MTMEKIARVRGLGAVGVIAVVAACGSIGTGPDNRNPDNAAGKSGNDGVGSNGGGSDPQGGGGKPSTSDGARSNGGSNDAANGDAGSSDGANGDAGSGNLASGSMPAKPGGFRASNLPEDLDIQVDGDLIINGETCGNQASLNTDTGKIGCSNSRVTPTYQFKVVKQADGSEVGVFAGRNILVAPNVTVTVEGQRPLVLLAPGSVQINGSINAIADTIKANLGNAGGFSGPRGSQVRGQGPGGGSGTSTDAGGGGFCGKGGKGGGGAGAAGGVAYGSATLVPLLGGSSGGNGGTGGEGGAGGGAVHIVAGGKLTLSATGVIHVGGGGGGWNGGGGGSGGAILLEASEISIAGTLAANGGGGGDGGLGASGLNASPDAVPAPSGHHTTATTDDGGLGSAADALSGSPGGSLSGGGGGGAGRIRLNSRSGAALVTGVLSPAVASACVTEGTLGR